MVVEFVGGPYDGLVRVIPDNFQAESHEWLFPIEFEESKKHVYLREPGADKFEYDGIK
jgi:hypothetical protein